MALENIEFQSMKNLIERLNKLEMDHELLGCVSFVARLSKAESELNHLRTDQESDLPEIKNKITKLESKFDAHFTKDVVNKYSAALCFESMNLPGIKERIQKLEDYMSIEDRVSASDVLNRLKELERSMADSLKRINDIGMKVILAENDKQKNQDRQIPRCIHGSFDHCDYFHGEKENDAVYLKFYDQEKKPHKCPVCEGMGKIKIPSIESNKCILYGLNSIESCNPCEGKGIVWG